MAEELSSHWRRSLDLFRIVLDRWPEELRRLGRIDLAERRTRLMARLAMRWRAAPPGGFVCAAGVTTASPSIARLLRCVAELPQGLVVLPGLGIDRSEEHTSELQSLMRISYAVFCLKKKTKHKHNDKKREYIIQTHTQ